MKRMNLVQLALLLPVLLIGTGVQAQPPCADVDGSGLACISDVVILIDGMYVSGNLDPGYAANAAGLDGYEGLSSNDLTTLVAFLFLEFNIDLPCATIYEGGFPLSDDTLKYSDLLVPAGSDTWTVDVLINGLTPFHSLSATFEYGYDGGDITLTDVEFFELTDIQEFYVQNAEAQVVTMAMQNLWSEFVDIRGYTPIARLIFSVTPSDYDQHISITPATWEHDNTMHTTVMSKWNKEDGTIDGYTPVILTNDTNPDQDAYGNFCFGDERGNVDGSWDEAVDIGDVTEMVDYMFISYKEPLAMGEADVAPLDGPDGAVDMGDITAMIDHLFISYCDLPTCDMSAVGKWLPQVDGSISAVHDGNQTIVTLSSNQELRGLKVVLEGNETEAAVSSSLEGQLDLIVGQRDGQTLTGLVDLDGPNTLPAGDNQILTLDGHYDIVSAQGSTMDHISIELSVGAAKPLPTTFALKQNYPNPFNPTTDISFSVPVSGHVQLVVYNSLGQQVRTLVDGMMNAGEATVTWDGTDNSGGSVASGIYLYRLTQNEQTDAKKMLLLK